VAAAREHWPWTHLLTEKGGSFYGRGVLDLNGEDDSIITALARMKRERYTPERDIVVVSAADEEVGSANGVE
jgi:acetylornithine deacetylase/succinyl-diaminopimelate desuccinylase-like protein